MPISIDDSNGNIIAGGGGSDGDLVLRANNGDDRMHLDAGGGNMWAGGNGADGDLVLRAEDGQNRMRFDAAGGNMWIGGNGADGDAVFFAASGDNTTLADATIRINGETGDLIIQNADCAEDFDIAQSVEVEPGMALVLGPDGLLYPCDSPYDKRVIGIAAGAGNFRPGIILGRHHGVEGRMPVALMGRVQCLADASEAPITAGDLLTTSNRPGHVMRADDPQKAFGAVIGKALSGLNSGEGMVEVVVALQ